MEKTLYICDPDKNINCKKTACAYLHPDGECKHTTHREFAKFDDDDEKQYSGLLEDE